MPSSEVLIASALESADVRIDGDRPWDVRVRDRRLFDRVVAQGSLGFGEAYMDAWWECDDLVELTARLCKGQVAERIPQSLRSAWTALSARVVNRQTRRRATKVAREHYDLGNDFYMDFLDPYNQYTCGYFRDTDDLNVAQERKLDLICRKLGIRSTDRVLDIGCGWGGFAKFAAERYGCRVTGISISDEQIAYARSFTRGLPVEILKMDYRDLRGTFDKVLVCGMIEHVGYKNYRTLFRAVRGCVTENGLFLLHTIGGRRSVRLTDPWIERYIFPNSMLPSAAQLTRAADGLFLLEDWHNFGAHYEPTLLAWYRNVERTWHTYADRYGERFHRMWTYYLLLCAGTFRARYNQLWQIVWSPWGVTGGYETVR